MRTISDRLPMADLAYPTCGSCGGETYHDGDSLRCDDCKLTFDPASLEAEYADEEDAACGTACDNFWHGDGKISTGWGYDCGACILPAGHISGHYTDCRARKIAS